MVDCRYLTFKKLSFMPKRKKKYIRRKTLFHLNRLPLFFSSCPLYENKSEILFECRVCNAECIMYIISERILLHALFEANNS